jgi:hypothetical protein
MLQRVEAKVGEVGDILAGCEDPEEPALLVHPLGVHEPIPA